MQAAEQIITDDPARGRVDKTAFIIVSEATNAREWVTAYLASNPQWRIPIVINADELRAARGDTWFIRNQLTQQLFSRDLFDYQLPLNNDLYFFGRDRIIAEYSDAIKRSQNRGIFGLRKTGKTSVLYKLHRLAAQELIGGVFYYDCKLPSIRSQTWDELLKSIIDDVSNFYNISVRGKSVFDKKKISATFLKTISRTPQGKTTVLIFDEIEYISPLTTLDVHWSQDFIPMWQTIWAAQSQIRRLSTIIAGVNPTVVEKDVFDGIQNPMFGIIRPTYLIGFERDDVRSMINHLGRRMGLKFESDCIEYLYDRYGGHPLLTRMACSHINSMVVRDLHNKPCTITKALASKDEEERDAELSYYCRHVVSELKQFYPDEYEMLELLSSRQIVDFIELDQDPELSRHLSSYGLITKDTSGKPKFAIPVVGKYVAMELARREKRTSQRYVTPKDKRAKWLERRAELIIREMRSLERMLDHAARPSIYGVNSFPEADRIHAIKECVTASDFDSFINIFFRSLVESIGKFGASISIQDYFNQNIKNEYPDLWRELHRIRVYRNNSFHLRLTKRNESDFREFLRQDLDGREPDEMDDGWFVLQQCVLDGVLLGIMCEQNRHS